MSMFGPAPDAVPRSLRAIAREIFADWPKMAANEHHPAHPYVHAMRGLETVADQYGADRGDDIVRRFLGNATGWRGDTARRVKAELKALLNTK